MPQSSVLVTGASGTIGRELVAALARGGVAFETLSSRPGAGSRHASFDDEAALARAFAGFDTVFVLLPLVPHKIALARQVAAAAKAAGVRQLVRSSGAGADPASPFALPRLQGTIDALLADTGLATTFLRPAGFMQNWSGFLAPAVRAGLLQLSSGGAAQSLVDARDIAAAAAAVLREPAAHAGRAYTLTGGAAETDAERAAVLSRLLGREIRVVDVPAGAARAGMAASGMPAEMVEWLASLNDVVRAGHAAGLSPDVQALTGREPIGFERFAADHRAAWA